MEEQLDIIMGTHARMKKAWLLTWAWTGNRAGIPDRYVAIFSSRFSAESIKKFLEQYYMSNYFTIFEQVAYSKSKLRDLCKITLLTVQVSERTQKLSSIPPHVPFNDSMIIGDNPWILARIIFDVET